jgi:hypothetical protein
MTLAGRLSGITYRASDGSPIEGVVVTAWDAAGAAVASIRSRADGTFVLAVAPGIYRIVAHDAASTYATSYSGGASSFALATAIVVIEGVETPNILMPMALAGHIRGSVVRQSDSAAVPGASIYVYDMAGIEIAVTESDRSGAFSIALPAGSYKLAAADRHGRFATVFHQNAGSLATATPIRVEPMQSSNVTFVVEPSSFRRLRPARTL